MKFPPLRQGEFGTRTNRFSAVVAIKNENRLVYVPNTGRLNELLRPGAHCFLSYQSSISRKTDHDLVLVSLDYSIQEAHESNSNLVCIDSRISPLLVWESVWAGSLSEFQGYQSGLKEVKFGGSRLDLEFNRFDKRLYVEVKSVNLVRDRIALFPDAPTSRGCRQLKTLVEAIQRGNRAAIVFVVQRSDAEMFSVNHVQDPDFALMLRWAMNQGVEVFAYKCQVTFNDIWITNRIPVDSKLN